MDVLVAFPKVISFTISRNDLKLQTFQLNILKEIVQNFTESSTEFSVSAVLHLLFIQLWKSIQNSLAFLFSPWIIVVFVWNDRKILKTHRAKVIRPNPSCCFYKYSIQFVRLFIHGTNCCFLFWNFSYHNERTLCSFDFQIRRVNAMCTVTFSKSKLNE